MLSLPESHRRTLPDLGRIATAQMFPDFLYSIIQPQQLRSGDTIKMFLCSAALFLLDGTITHRPKDRATESKYRAYLQAYQQRWNTTQLLTAHISVSLSAQTAHPYTDQRKLSLVNQEIDRSKVSTPKGKRSPSNRGTLEPFKNHNQMESKNPLARCERTDTTPT